jgi:hypothetical protein
MVDINLGKTHEFSIYTRKLYKATKSRRNRCLHIKTYEDMLKYITDYHIIRNKQRKLYDEYFTYHMYHKKTPAPCQHDLNAIPDGPSIQILKSGPEDNPIIYHYLRSRW